MTVREESYGNVEITPHPVWAEDFWNSLVPLKDRIGQHPLFSQMSSGALPVTRFRYMLLNFYPLVANFPHYMGLTLAKSYEAKVPGVLQTRDWLINNIKVEQRHLYWYRDWALGFGISTEALDNVVPPAAMDAVNHYLWHVNQRGSIAEGLAATNLAIEWSTTCWPLITATTSPEGPHVVSSSARGKGWARSSSAVPVRAARYPSVHRAP